MQFTDAVTVAGTRRREDGYLVADARIARTGIQTYLGSEVGKPDMSTVRVYRPGSEVFAEDTLKSAAHRPVTNDHPPEMVTSENWKKFAVGQTSDEITGEGIFIRVPLMVSDEATIKDIEAGKQELSAGYTCDLDFTAGVTPTGEAYDAMQKNIRINHVAIVRAGRAGSKVRIGDAAPWGAAPITTDHKPEEDKIMNLKTVTVDGIPVEVTDQGATVIATLLQRLADSTSKFTAADAAHLTAIAAKDAELAKKDAEIDALKAKVLSDVDIDKRVQERADLIALAGSIAKDVKTAGLSDAAIRKAVVAAKLGDAVIAGKPDAYIDARFDILAEDAKKTVDPFARAVADGLHQNDGGDYRAQAEKAKQERNRSLADAWKGTDAA
ncbi:MULTISPECIES: DUF2213 domain-containing protein [Rhizobium]|uniref:DUF2213 domain-containing protein n=1 Tax=Rhizobium TaxID=379 RepID=UPI001A938BCE|nr:MULTISPECIES: DUF2213 domain-containing protein [Rhizobium]MBX4872694.1 DUF2213 domain-containing protein [Rhizobium bangladeshense]MBX5063309.1 DUF2213 domain-containing protein [Rhizobium lentis]MBX5075414.1 DUF2213 domain-containing protein [Rhizobium lentis]QSW93066.1 DUF2213 domain-containing protein [Rhizobium lentis]